MKNHAITVDRNSRNDRLHDQARQSTPAPSSVINRRSSFLLVSLVGFGLLAAALHAHADTRTISRATLLDKIRGGWAGQMIGVAYGAPTEFKSKGKILEGDLAWKPGMLENTLHQDDLYVEMTFAKVMDDRGLDATSRDYGRAFKDSQYSLWHANAGARRALNQGIEPPWSGHPKYNFHANDIDFQIEADFIGLMCPGLPRTANKLGDRVGHVMNYGDGVYGGMFVDGMYAAAFFENDPRKVVEAGLACIPAKSQYGLLIRDLLDGSAQYPNNWRKVWQLVQDKWDKDDPCPEGAMNPFNIDAKLNGAYIALGLLYGGGDFLKTIEVSTRCGQDSDCNPSSAAGVLGVMLGYERIPAEFKAEMTGLENKKFDFTDYSFNEIVKSTEARALKAIQQAGGKVTPTEVLVRLQTPKAPKLEQWSPGVPYRRISVRGVEWSFQGSWQTSANAKSVRGAGGEATLRFNGVAVVILGPMGESGGRADVFLDGKKQKQPLDAYIGPRTWDNVLWSGYGLKLGEHTLRIVPSDQVDARSKGNAITLDQAIIYRAP
jgi:hypothetical protein